jgi:hypothetical protein
MVSCPRTTHLIIESRTSRALSSQARASSRVDLFAYSPNHSVLSSRFLEEKERCFQTLIFNDCESKLGDTVFLSSNIHR